MRKHSRSRQAVTGLSRFSPLTVVMMMIAGASWVLTLSTFNVSVQLATPRWVVARALSMYQVMTFGGMAAGSWLWGVISESDGVRLGAIRRCLGDVDLRRHWVCGCRCRKRPI